MAISIYQNLSHLGPEAADIGLTIVNVVVAATFVVQMIGPSFVRLAVSKAGEIGRDVNEEDIIESYIVADLIEKDIPTIQEDAHLDAMVEQIKKKRIIRFLRCGSSEKTLRDDLYRGSKRRSLGTRSGS